MNVLVFRYAFEKTSNEEGLVMSLDRIKWMEKSKAQQGANFACHVVALFPRRTGMPEGGHTASDSCWEGKDVKDVLKDLTFVSIRGKSVPLTGEP